MVFGLKFEYVSLDTGPAMCLWMEVQGCVFVRKFKGVSSDVGPRMYLWRRTCPQRSGGLVKTVTKNEVKVVVCDPVST